jgi:pyruvate kinase
VDLYFDVKARQPRVIEVIPNEDHLDLRLNHAVEVPTPSVVIFKGGVDHAMLDHLEEGGRRLVFQGGPRYKVKAGESLYLRDPGLKILGDLFIPEEVTKIEKCRKAGFKKWFLSYVEEERDIDQFLELAGPDSEVWLKIESMRGLSFVADHFKKRENLVLVAARGDLYVEIDRPHRIAQALRLIVGKDPEACAASRLLLSVVEGPVPSCADFLELQWLYDVGYRRMMLCDELCLKGELLGTAVNAFEAWRSTL